MLLIKLLEKRFIPMAMTIRFFNMQYLSTHVSEISCMLCQDLELCFMVYNKMIFVMLFLYWKQGMSIRLKDEKHAQFECYFQNKSV